jgi:hypothetical protein
LTHRASSLQRGVRNNAGHPEVILCARAAAGRNHAPSGLKFNEALREALRDKAKADTTPRVPWKRTLMDVSRRDT